MKFSWRIVCLAAALSGASPSHAAPSLRIRARTRLVLDTIARAPDGVRIAVRLLDTSTGETLGHRPVAISIEGPAGFYRYAEATDWNGRVEFRAPLHAGHYDLRLAAGSDADHAAPDPLQQTLDLGRRQPCIELAAPTALNPDATTMTLGIVATDCELMAGQRPPAEVDFRVDIDGQAVASGHTTGGRSQVELPSHRLGARGRQIEVGVTFAGDDRYAERTVTTKVALLGMPALVLGRAKESHGGRYTIDGELRFEEPIAGGGTIDLVEESDDDATGERRAPLARLAVAERQAFVLGDVMLAVGVHRVRARFVPHSALLLPVTSDAISIVVRPAPPLTWLWPPLAALGVSLLVPLVMRRRARAPTPDSPRPRPPAPARPRDDDSVHVLVRDALRLRPLVGVVVAGSNGTSTTDAEGVARLDPQTTFASCALPGFLPRRIELSTKLAGVLVLDLVSRRELAYREFLAAAARVGRGVPIDGERATPREILERLQHKAILLAPLPELTAVLEALYFGRDYDHTPESDAALEVLAQRLGAIAGTATPPPHTPAPPPRPRSEPLS